MSEATQYEPVRVTGRRWGRLIAVVLLCSLGLVAAWYSRRPPGAEAGSRSWLGFLRGWSGRPAVLPLGLDSEYRNIRPGVSYLGDDTCTRCHQEIARAYRNHPMGRSLAEVTPATISGGDSHESPSFKAQGFEYSIEQRGNRVFHKETKRDASGRVISQNEAVARYVIGSGAQALAFLLERGDGYLFESPITWYSRKQKWDLSPGYERDNPHFERFVKPTCLFCHSNQFDHVDGSENRYQQPIFRGHAIGCERCHGPGELHVKQPDRVGDQAPNIVNPASLQPALREAVCEQCHLQGDIRIVRAGRSLTDFRPGLPLSSVESVFVKVDNAGKTRFFGQVEQMHESRCFRESKGKMGCISCHDPHRLPDPREKASYYRERCLSCHAERGCRLPEPERMALGRDDRCIDCHMPRSPNEQVPHTATTLHMIPRFIDRVESVSDPLRRPRDRGAPLVHFHRDQLDAADHAAVSRDLGIALAMSSQAIPGMSPGTVSRMALPLLETSVQANSADGLAWQAKGNTLWLLGRREESLQALRTALKESPHREETLIAAGTRAAQMGKHEEALGDLERAIAINPWRADYHQVVAMIHAQRQQWNAAIEASRNSLRLNPANQEARMLLVECLQRNQQEIEARAEFQTLLDHDPPDREALQTWFDQIRHR